MNSKKVRDSLAVFYEGFFEELAKHGHDINFKIECSYLADLIKPGFNYFYGTIKHVEEFYFIPWEDEVVKIEDVKEIQSLKLDILGAEYLNDKIKIYSNCAHSYTGGNLYLRAAEVKIYDEHFEQMDPDVLQDLAEKYWDAVNKF